jgi:hypothetical protein
MISKYLPAETEESTIRSSSLDSSKELFRLQIHSLTATSVYLVSRQTAYRSTAIFNMFFPFRRNTDHARIGTLHLAPLAGRTATHRLKINIQLPQRISGIAEGDMRYVKPILIGDCCILVYRLRSVIKNDEKW